MKIQYCSDLHLEFPENKNFLDEYPIQPEGEILLLAGDILPFALQKKQFEFLDYIANNFEMVYWLPGNHEYYHYDVANVASPLFEKIYENVILVNNQTISYKKTNFIFSTLWSNISPQNEWDIQQSISDFSLIKINGKRFTPAHYNSLHQLSLDFLKSAVAKVDPNKAIVITHHVPTYFNYPEQYRNSPLNEAFVVELYDFIFDSKVNCWVHGHHHINTRSFKIGDTEMHTNQLGYVQQNEHTEFRKNAIIEI